eukprot:6240338-Amphidinium_carterae.2
MVALARECTESDMGYSESVLHLCIEHVCTRISFASNGVVSNWHIFQAHEVSCVLHLQHNHGTARANFAQTQGNLERTEACKRTCGMMHGCRTFTSGRTGVARDAPDQIA